MFKKLKEWIKKRRWKYTRDYDWYSEKYVVCKDKDKYTVTVHRESGMSSKTKEIEEYGYYFFLFEKNMRKHRAMKEQGVWHFDDLKSYEELHWFWRKNE